MQEMYNFGQSITKNDDMRDFGACNALVDDFREAFNWMLRHLNPAVWVASLVPNALAHAVGLVRLVPNLLTDLASMDIYKIGYDLGDLFKMLFN